MEHPSIPAGEGGGSRVARWQIKLMILTNVATNPGLPQIQRLTFGKKKFFNKFRGPHDSNVYDMSLPGNPAWISLFLHLSSPGEQHQGGGKEDRGKEHIWRRNREREKMSDYIRKKKIRECACWEVMMMTHTEKKGRGGGGILHTNGIRSRSRPRTGTTGWHNRRLEVWDPYSFSMSQQADFV